MTGLNSTAPSRKGGTHRDDIELGLVPKIGLV